MKLRYIQPLDGLRGIAALMVMFFHFFQDNPISGNAVANVFQKLTGFGQTGVTLFFVLSGFLITRILIAQKGNDGYFSNFYMRRAVRIFPLYYGFLCLFYFALPLIRGTDIPTFSEQIYYWLYLQNFATTFGWPSIGPGHFWSLAVEEHFYLFWPFMVYFLTTQRLEKAIYIIVLFAMGLRYYMTTQELETFYFTFTRFDSLAIGSLMAIYEKKGFLERWTPKHFLIGLVSVFVPTILLWIATSGKQLDAVQVFKFTLLSLVYLLSMGLLVVSTKGNWLYRLFTMRPLLYAGKISYGLYVFHRMAFDIYFANIGTLGVWIDFVLCIALSFVIAALSFHFFEARFLRLKRFFEYAKK